MIISIIMGVFGSFYIFVHREYCSMKKRYKSFWFFNPWIYTITIALIIINAEYFSKITQNTDKEVIKSMIDIDWIIQSNNHSIYDDNSQDYTHWDYDDMKDVHKWLFGENYMLLFIFEKFIFTVLTLSCPVPAGIFMPIFCLGAVCGQFYCSVLIRILGSQSH